MQSKLRNSLASTKGFTLVELLIVVAIIGVLASQGVPAYKRMIQKSRKGEAQMLLGNIATAESGFFSEYGVYSNHVARLGAMAEGTSFTYAAGFPNNACAQTAGPAILPTQAQVQNLPVGFQNFVAQPQSLGGIAVLSSVIGRAPGNVLNGTQRRTCQVNVPVGVPAGFVPPNQATVGVFIAAAGTGQPSQYLASATGNIVDPTGPNGSVCPNNNPAFCDVWMMNMDRRLINVQDGVRN